MATHPGPRQMDCLPRVLRMTQTGNEVGSPTGLSHSEDERRAEPVEDLKPPVARLSQARDPVVA